MEFHDILYQVEKGIVLITLNRPRALNSLTVRLQEEWWQAMELAQADDRVKVVVVTGVGRAFCSGADLRTRESRMLPVSSPIERDILSIGSHHWVEAAAFLDKPYIAAINGPTAGGGMDMMAMCDLRIASERATFTTAYVRLGITPPMNLAYALPRLVGLQRACELLWTGRRLDAQEALKMGLVNQVVPHEQLMPATLALARRLARYPLWALRESKRLIYQCWELDLPKALKAIEGTGQHSRARLRSGKVGGGGCPTPAR